MNRLSSLVLALAVSGSALVALSNAADRPDGPPPPPREEGGGPGGPGGDRPGRGGPPGGVHVIPRFAEDKLNLTDEQRKQIADLEKEMKEKLAKILTPEQLKTLEQARPPRIPGRAGPEGPGDRRGPRDRGGPSDEQAGPGDGQRPPRYR
jgi:Spy/CpxP family protein refolding chaperone